MNIPAILSKPQLIAVALLPLAIYLAIKVGISLLTLNTSTPGTALADSLTQAINSELKVIDKRLTKLKPKSNYLVVNSTANEFYLYEADTLLAQGKCSTGSYVLLKNGDLQQWIFKTPKGEFKILNKKKNPIWKKPDWAFIEEGLPVPAINHSSRFEYGVLGDYALSLGDGYLIHGTIYQRFIGLPVTHGCIRLNDENLALIYKKLNIGSKVYLF
ncbi:L,D-transpeptidase [Fulvivirga lutea]|uniref:L,D-transpeptidase n=1 Tax=Fulvivirga lutea TaxID=2810512 RepID=A0A974WFE2_9BACT|nr:L,D-transpeptidase [Fulvivirga lutea]QSE96488.1 L,D-transpeptidase [Fulvivirga lutea]